MDETVAHKLIAALDQNTAAVKQHTAALNEANGHLRLLTATSPGAPLSVMRQMVESLKTAMGQLAHAVARR